MKIVGAHLNTVPKKESPRLKQSTSTITHYNKKYWCALLISPTRIDPEKSRSDSVATYDLIDLSTLNSPCEFNETTTTCFNPEVKPIWNCI